MKAQNVKKLLGSGVVALFVAAWILLGNPFVSQEKNERVSDQIMIDNAIDYYLENSQYERAKAPGGGVNYYKIFETREEFTEAFPDCCRFTMYGTEGPDGLRLSRRERLKSNFAGVVVIKAKARRIVEDGVVMVGLLAHEIYISRSGEIIPK